MHSSTLQSTVRIGLYGINGHQVDATISRYAHASLVAVAAFPDGRVADQVAHYDTLPAMLASADLDLVVLCSPRRADQAVDAIRCMEAGCAVLAEKPCALTEQELNQLLAVSKRTGSAFWEMSGQRLDAYASLMHEQVCSGAIGDVVQVLVQKSYPWAEWRPDDEALDGGLAAQVGIYGARFAEYVADQRVCDLSLRETRLGNERQASECRRAVELSMEFESGAIGTCVSNYCNPIGGRCWGYDIFRIFGTEGILEYSAEQDTVRLLKGDTISEWPVAEESAELLGVLIDSLRDGRPMPMSIEDSIRPTLWVLRAKAQMV